MVILSGNLGLYWGVSLEEGLNARITPYAIFVEMQDVFVRRIHLIQFMYAFCLFHHCAKILCEPITRY